MSAIACDTRAASEVAVVVNISGEGGGAAATPSAAVVVAVVSLTLFEPRFATVFFDSFMTDTETRSGTARGREDHPLVCARRSSRRYPHTIVEGGDRIRSQRRS